MTSIPHRLAAVLFADLVGYSRLAGRDERAALRLVQRFQDAARATADRHAGRIVKFLGDGALAEFPSTESAVRAAADLTRRMDVDGADAIRVAVHVGDVATAPDGDLYGDGVNVASRLQSEARPGQVVVSEDVYRQLRPRQEFRFEPLGSRQLRGMDEPVAVYAVEVDEPTVADDPAPAVERAERVPSEPGSRPAWRRPAIVIPAAIACLVVVALFALLTGGDDPPTAGAVGGDLAPAVAILPFRTTGPGLEMWQEGVVDLMSANLDGAAGLRAIDPRTTLARWAALDEASGSPDLGAALDVARRTGARYALLGSAAALGPEVRLVADVYDVESGDVLGRAQAEGAPDSVYALIDRLSMDVLETLFEGRAADLPRVDLARVTTTSLPALREFLEGEILFRRSDFEAAIPPYQRAVAADSTFALALLRLSICHGWTEGLVGTELPLAYAERAARYAARLPDREQLLVRGHLMLVRGDLEALEPLQEGVGKYPDDVELWHSLAETYTHLGGAALVDRQTHDQAYERAIDLDPSFSPAYIHLIESKFLVADSAAVTDLVERYDRVAQDDFRSFARVFETGRDLAWGDAATRARARATFDSLDVDEAAQIPFTVLLHPRFLPLAEELTRALEERADRRTPFPVPEVMVAIGRGQVKRTFALLDAPATAPPFRRGITWYVHVLGLPVPAERLAALVAPLPADTAASTWTTIDAFHAGTLAVETERRRDVERAIERLRTDADRRLAAGDSAGSRFARGAILGLEGYAAWRRGSLDRAVSLLETARTTATGYGPEDAINQAIRIWLGEIHLATDRPDRAVVYFESILDPAFVLDRLGRAYEAAGEREKARESYELYLLANAEADPALAPRIEAARQALVRLGFGRRG